MANKINSTNLLMLVAIVAVGFASVNLIITINKIGDIKTLTGYAFDTATANLTITENIQINFTTDNINWGSGYVTGTNTSATLNTLGIMNGTGWTPVSAGLILENIGNVNVTLNLSSSANAATFIGGDTITPLFQWDVSEATGNTGACSPGVNISVWTSVTTTPQIACTNFGATGTMDELEIDLQVVIPDNAEGTKGATITATASALP